MLIKILRYVVILYRNQKTMRFAIRLLRSSQRRHKHTISLNFFTFICQSKNHRTNFSQKHNL